MSYLEKLLEGVEVEWKSLGEVADLKRGKTITAKTKTDGNIPVISGGQKPAYYNSESNRDGETITIAGSGAYAGYIMFWNEPIFVSDAFSVKPNLKILNTRYIFHYLLINQSWIYNLQKGSGVPHVYPKDIAKLQIPIPPLSVQKEIVRILDTFTELTAKLTTELTARKQQYSFYREELLRFEEGEVEWKTLGEVVFPTSNIRWRDTNKSYRYIDLSSVCRDTNTIKETISITKDNAPSRAQKLICKDDIIFATTRPTQQRLCLITEEYSNEVASTGYCVLRAKSDLVLPKWIYFLITSNKFNIYVEENQSGSAYPAISDTKVKEFRIPIPPLEEQARIVSILDKFDMLTTSISEGLPKEIELRQKQYEYYRDRLLAFPK